jgi:hypothetical protein
MMMSGGSSVDIRQSSLLPHGIDAIPSWKEPAQTASSGIASSPEFQATAAADLLYWLARHCPAVAAKDVRMSSSRNEKSNPRKDIM